MIYTVTFNPAIDYVMHIDKMDIGKINRSQREEILAGGKGINVSLVLAQLGIPSIALGFIAGFTGDAIEQSVKHAGVAANFVRLDSGCSRINVKIKSDVESELNGQGPEIAEHKIEELYSKLEHLKQGDTLILAGSIPASLPDDIYERILQRLDGKGIRVVVDATKNLLLNVLKYKPFLIKPNNHELSEIFGVELSTSEQIAIYAARLQKMGARNVLVSMAGDGAVLLDESGELHVCGVCKGVVRNSVGAGDSMVAGFVAACELGKGYDYALKLGTASGGATAFSDGLAEKSTIEALLKQLL